MGQIGDQKPIPRISALVSLDGSSDSDSLWERQVISDCETAMTGGATTLEVVANRHTLNRVVATVAGSLQYIVDALPRVQIFAPVDDVRDLSALSSIGIHSFVVNSDDVVAVFGSTIPPVDQVILRLSPSTMADNSQDVSSLIMAIERLSVLAKLAPRQIIADLGHELVGDPSVAIARVRCAAQLVQHAQNEVSMFVSPAGLGTKPESEMAETIPLAITALMSGVTLLRTWRPEIVSVALSTLLRRI